jgi:hypothetical protein
MKIKTRELEGAQFPSTEKTSEEIKHERKKRIVRNEFRGVGKYEMPLIRKQDIDLNVIDLMSYTKATVGDTENNHKTLHFFTYDWLFSTVYRKPDEAMEKLGQYYALLSPDFSMYTDMPIARQIDSVFRNRWCGAYWQRLGAKVIPTVSWGEENSYEYCFDGIEQGSVVAVSTYSRENYEALFMKGFDKMLEVIKPNAVICYGDAFKGMHSKCNLKVIPAFNHRELAAKLGQEEYLRKLMDGELYPS